MLSKTKPAVECVSSIQLFKHSWKCQVVWPQEGLRFHIGDWETNWRLGSFRLKVLQIFLRSFDKNSSLWVSQTCSPTWRTAGTALSSPWSWPAAPGQQLSPCVRPWSGREDAGGRLPALPASLCLKKSCLLTSGSLQKIQHSQFSSSKDMSTKVSRTFGGYQTI